jgi:hypothetical protein
MRSFYSFLFIFFLTLGFLLPGTVKAENYEGYYSSSMIMNFQGKPGETITKTLRFFNDTSDKSEAEFTVRDFIYENNSIIYEEDRPINFSVQKWAKLNVDKVMLQSKDYIDVEVTINIPANAEMGEHMALLEGAFIPAASKDSQMKIKTEIAPVVYVQVTDKNGNINLNKDWDLLGIKKDVLNGGHFIFSVKNNGNVHLESEGTVKITNLITKKKSEEKIPRVNLLPDHSKNILVRWESKDFIGVYKAEVDFSMDGERFEKLDTTLFLIPWLFVGITLGLILLFIILIRMYMKRLKKKWLAEAANDLRVKNHHHS